jgi:hypothetical protein
MCKECAEHKVDGKTLRIVSQAAFEGNVDLNEIGPDKLFNLVGHEINDTVIIVTNEFENTAVIQKIRIK